MASIIIQTGGNKGNYYPLGHRATVIGRDEALPVQVLDEHVSRKHVQIHYDPKSGEYIAIDMNSRHGVMINGIRINDEVVLSDDDYITIGKTSILFTLKDFEDKGSALLHYKKVGERIRATIPD